MSAPVPDVFAKAIASGRPTILFLDHDETTSQKGEVPWVVYPADRYLDAAKELIASGHHVIPHSARGFDGLKDGLPGLRTIIYNDGMGIHHNGEHIHQHGPPPYWAETHAILTGALPKAAKTRLLPQGFSYFWYVDEGHANYTLGHDAFAKECGRLNKAAGKEKWKCGTYSNGHIIELADKAGKKQGIIDFLDILCEEYGVADIDELLKRHIGAVIFADDSPGAIPAQEYVKSLPVGHSYLVSRDGTVPADTPAYVNEVVPNVAAMVDRIAAMARMASASSKV